jgi:hypothetical protein
VLQFFILELKRPLRMSSKAHKPDLFERSLELSKAHFEQGYYESAYHALMSALHCAELEDDEKALRRVSELGQSQEEYIDQLEPPHRLSRTMSDSRGTIPVYRSLQAHVTSALARMDSSRAVARAGLHLSR